MDSPLRKNNIFNKKQLQQLCSMNIGVFVLFTTCSQRTGPNLGHTPPNISERDQTLFLPMRMRFTPQTIFCKHINQSNTLFGLLFSMLFKPEHSPVTQTYSTTRGFQSTCALCCTTAGSFICSRKSTDWRYNITRAQKKQALLLQKPLWQPAGETEESRKVAINIETQKLSI